MRAAVYDRAGPAGEVPRIEEVPTPEPGHMLRRRRPAHGVSDRLPLVQAVRAHERVGAGGTVVLEAA